MGGRQDEEQGIPNPETGVGVGASEEPNTFEPEEPGDEGA
ncbi:hypothetical protein GCM10023225_24650 [Kineococcus glutinatus]|uniref:Uncharacterized protein n=1 Tax=Kineococcus glutinatus TaxID=1070872 RepID=A0ABP9I1X5_9ACTN